MQHFVRKMCVNLLVDVLCFQKRRLLPQKGASTFWLTRFWPPKCSFLLQKSASTFWLTRFWLPKCNLLLEKCASTKRLTRIFEAKGDIFETKSASTKRLTRILKQKAAFSKPTKRQSKSHWVQKLGGFKIQLGI